MRCSISVVSEVPRSTSMPLNQLNVVLNTYDVVLTRSDHDGFGFVIISSVNKNGSTIGELTGDFFTQQL